MNGVKVLVKCTFLGGFFAACLGMFIGCVILPPILWPDSNLEPLVGMICGIPIGALSGAALGLIVGIVRVLRAKPRAAHELQEAERMALAAHTDC
jgi:hypothetical protein